MRRWFYALSIALIMLQIHNLLSAVSEYIATSAGRDELGPDMPSSLSRGGGLAIKVF